MALDERNGEEELEEQVESFEVGDQVKHPKWGVGTVMFKSGTGENTKVVVVFQEEGQKKLLAKKARLKKVH
jgi:DNA helicase-2/ATP-dependent DNA helicase PcrA